MSDISLLLQPQVTGHRRVIITKPPTAVMSPCGCSQTVLPNWFQQADFLEQLLQYPLLRLHSFQGPVWQEGPSYTLPAYQRGSPGTISLPHVFQYCQTLFGPLQGCDADAQKKTSYWLCKWIGKMCLVLYLRK